MEYYYNHDTKCARQIQPLDDEVFRLVDRYANQDPYKYEQRLAWILNNLRDHPNVLFTHPDASYLPGVGTNVTFLSLCSKEWVDEKLLDLSSTTKSYLVVTKIKMYGSNINVSFIWKDSAEMNALIRHHTIDLILHDLG